MLSSEVMVRIMANPESIPDLAKDEESTEDLNDDAS